jgi:hypothetical protein
MWGCEANAQKPPRRHDSYSHRPGQDAPMPTGGKPQAGCDVNRAVLSGRTQLDDAVSSTPHMGVEHARAPTDSPAAAGPSDERCRALSIGLPCKPSSFYVASPTHCLCSGASSACAAPPTASTLREPRPLMPTPVGRRREVPDGGVGNDLPLAPTASASMPATASASDTVIDTGDRARAVEFRSRVLGAPAERAGELAHERSGLEARCSPRLAPHSSRTQSDLLFRLALNFAPVSPQIRLVIQRRYG